MTVTGIAAVNANTTTWNVTRGSSPQSYQTGAVVEMVDAISATTTLLQVGSAIGYPSSYPFYVGVDNEIMKVTAQPAINGGTPSGKSSAGAFGSTATTHAQGATVRYYPAIGNTLNYYFDKMIDDLFVMYSNGETLTLTGSNGLQYTGTVVRQNGSTGPYVMRFTNSTDTYTPPATSFDPTPQDQVVNYDIFYPFFNDNRYLWATEGFTPSLAVSDAPWWLLNASVAEWSPTGMAVAVNGVFADNSFRTWANDAEEEYWYDNQYWNTADQNTLVANLENQLAAATNRGIVLTDPQDVDWANSDNFYKQHTGPHSADEVWNVYAAYFHQTDPEIMKGSFAYAMSYDDQGNFASDIGVASFDSASITLSEWGADPAPPPPPPPPITAWSQRDFLASTQFQSVPPQSQSVFVGPQAMSASSLPTESSQSVVDAALMNATGRGR